MKKMKTRILALTLAISMIFSLVLGENVKAESFSENENKTTEAVTDENADEIDTTEAVTDVPADENDTAVATTEPTENETDVTESVMCVMSSNDSTFEVTGGMITYQILENNTIAITGCDDTVTEAKIPDSIEDKAVTTISEYAFFKKTSLTSVVLPANLTNIGEHAFSGCTGLVSVDFSACTNTLDIGSYAFDDDEALIQVIFPSRLTSIGDGAFYGCNRLTSVDFSTCEETLNIGGSAFEYTAITSVVFPKGLKSVGKWAFDSCEDLKTVDFSACKELVSIEANAFSECGLTEVNLSVCSKLTSIGEYAFCKNQALTKVVFPTSLSTLGESAFYQCSALKSADISDTDLTVISDGAFRETGLTEMTLPDGVVTVEQNAFAGCTSLSFLAFGNNLESIGWQAFCETAITHLHLPDSLTTIGNDAFSNCKSLTSIEWPNNSAFTTVTGFDGCTALPVSELNEVLNLASVIEIGDYAFSNCSFDSVVIPSSIKKIGEDAFYDTGMTSLTLSPGVEVIGAHAFAYCEGLAGTKVIVPETVNEIYGGAFKYCFKEQVGEKESTYTAIVVEFPNRDFKLMPYNTSGGPASTEMVTIDGVNYEDPFAERAVIRAYQTDSEGNPSMLKQFYEAQQKELYADRYTFEALDETKQMYTVSGTIPTGAEIEVFQNNQKLTVTFTGNRFSVKAEAGTKVTAEVMIDGYYNKHFIQMSLDEDWNLGEIIFSDEDRLPVNNLMKVDFGTAVVNSFRNLEISLKADERILKEGTDYVLQYPNVVLKETVTENNLTLTVNADDIGYAGGSVTASREEGIFKLSLKAWGKLKITTDSSFAGDNNILVFNENGSLEGKSKIASDGLYLTEGLKAGTYTIIAYNVNDSFSAVTSMDVLEGMGLTEGKDYAKVMAEVSDGETNQVEIKVPLLKNNVSGLLDKEKCSIVSKANYVIKKQTFNVSVYYGFAEGKSGKISLLLPDNMSLRYVCTETESLKDSDYTVSGNTITINKTLQEGMLYLGLSCEKTGVYSFSAVATADGITAPIGSKTLTVHDYEIRPAAGDLYSLTGNKVTVYAAPYSGVTLLLDGNQVGTGNTNGLGNATFTYNLPADTLQGQTFLLTAEVAGGQVSTEVTYARTSAALDSWSFYQTNRLGSNYNGGYLYSTSQYFTPPSFYWYLFNEEADNDWTICAEFIGGIAPENVVTYMKTLDGTVHTVPMQLLKTEQLTEGKGYRFTFAGEVTLPSSGTQVVTEAQLPEEFSIDWVDQGQTFTYDADMAEKSQKKAAEITAQRKQESEEIATSLAETRNQYMKEYAQTNGLTYTENPDFNASEYIFGAKYRVSETMPEWFEKQTPEVQAAFYNAEKAIDEAMESFSEMMGLKKNITEYQSWEEVYADMGITMKENTRTAEELRADGFEVCENADGTFTAFKDHAKESEKTQSAVHMKTAETALAREGGVSGITGGYTFIDASGNEIDYNGEAAANFDQGARNAFIGSFGNALDALDQVMHMPGVTDSQLALNVTTGMATAGSLIGAATGIEGAMQDSEAYVDYTVREADMQGYIDELKMFEERYKDKPLCSNAIMRERYVAMDLRLYMGLEKDRYCANSVVGSLFTIAGAMDKTVTTTALSAMWDFGSNYTGVRRAAEVTRLSAELDRLTRERKQKCDDTDMEKIMKKTHKVQPIMDPSGFVYEAVESNTLSDVKATVYYAEDSSGTNAQVWNAEDYEQINPQITDDSGVFAWDVPTGWWQVRFEKDGYENAQTEWMRVPPPKMGLKIAMISEKTPEVVSANAYTDYIEVVFSQYMDTTENPVLPEGMTGEWQMVENGYSKVLHITKEGGFRKDDIVSFTLKGVKNYAGKTLADYNSGDLTVSVRPAEIILNYENIIPAKAGEEATFTVRVKDSEGNYVENVTVEALIGSTQIASFAENKANAEAVTDADGKTKFQISTNLPGYTNMTFRVKGTTLEKVMKLHVSMEENRPKRPTAQIGETLFDENSPKNNYITVSEVEMLTLTAEEGVTIYYTTDDTCPCQNSASRKIYTKPIKIMKNTKYRIAAYKDGMDYSERLNITVTVDAAHVHDYGAEWKSDSESHWHECICGAHANKAAHDMEVKNAKAATETETGYTGDQVCKVCGYIISGTVIPVKEATKSDDSKPADTTENLKPADVQDNKEPSETSCDEKSDPKENALSPKTGDQANLSLWFALIVISCFGMATCIMYEKKHRRNFFPVKHTKGI